jgi:BCCT family betaine/carnitine transporter
MKKIMKEKKETLIDKWVFIGSMMALLAMALPIIFFPEASKSVVGTLNNLIITNLGSAYLWYGMFCTGFCIWIAYGRYGKIRLGAEDEKPEFSTFSWAAMLFCCGVGAGVVYWGIIEWVYYYTAPPLGIEVGTWQAAEIAASYGIFHWGPIAWSIYSVTACAIGYLLYVRKSDVLKASEACRGVLGNKIDGPIGRLLDVFFIFGIVGAVATSLGLGSPLISASIGYVFGIEVTPAIDVLVLVSITLLFGVSAYSGLKKGIKILSDVNAVIAIFLVVFVFIVGNTRFMLDMTTTSIGYVATNVLRMATWLDPAGDSMFPQSWTVFYWAWWGGYAPFLGMFIAKISKGRTIKQMITGSLLFGSLGCIIFFGVLGNYGLSLQLNGTLDVVKSLGEIGAPQTIVTILSTLPMGKFIVGVVGVLCIIFAATSYDSASYIIAANTQKRLENGEPVRWLRLLWAFALALIPMGFILLNAPLRTLQTATLVLSIPVAFIVLCSALSFTKMVKEDIASGFLSQKLVVNSFPEICAKEIRLEEAKDDAVA